MSKKIFLIVIFAISVCVFLYDSSLLSVRGQKLSPAVQQRIEEAIKNLDTIKREVKQKAIKELIGIGSDAIEPLLAAAKDSNKAGSLRAKCLYVLGEIKDTAVVPELISFLKKDYINRIRYEAARALGKIGDKRAVPHLLELLNEEEAAISFYSIEALGNIGDSSVAYQLSNILLSDPNEKVRLEVIRAFDALDARSESTAVIRALSDSDSYIRAYAVELCAIWKVKDALPKIIQMMRYETDEIVKISCTQALGKYRDISAVPVLIRALTDMNRDVRIYASGSLKRISDKDFGYNRMEWTRWYEEETR